MGIKVALEHRTSYTFDRLVEVHPHVVRLRPAPHSRTPIEAYSLQVEPADHFINWQQDAFGNFLARLVFPNRARSLTITVGLIADMRSSTRSTSSSRTGPNISRSNTPRRSLEDLKPYLRPVDEGDEGSGPGDLAQAWVKNFAVPPGTRTIDFLVALNRAVNADVGYSVRMEPGVQTPDHTLRTGIGSCRDSAWLLVSILRQLGYAARFVSGYLVQLASDVEALDGPSGPAADFTDLHAWAEVYVPGAGWIGMDPTSGLFAGEGHIPLSATPHPASAAPITGATELVRNRAGLLQRRHPGARGSAGDAALHRAAVGRRSARWGPVSTRRLAAGDVRLTVGGEPTFVSIDNQVDPGVDHRRRRAAQATARLGTGGPAEEGVGAARTGAAQPGQVVSGRTVAALADRTVLAHRRGAAVDGTRRCSPTLADPAARRSAIAPDAGLQLLGAIADGLGLPASQVRPAYEDCAEPAGRYGAAARGRPCSAQGRPRPTTTRDRRKALLARLEDHVTEPAAYVLPLHRRDDETGWASADWQLRRGRIVLLEGDSPAGLRLPLSSISWRPPAPPFRRRPAGRPRQAAGGARTRMTRPVEDAEDAERVPVTAMVAEVRDGMLYVFLPPTEALEDFVDLIARIEAAAAKIDCPVVVEGYGPPPDDRLHVDERHPRPRCHRGQRRADAPASPRRRRSWKPSTTRPGWRG